MSDSTQNTVNGSTQQVNVSDPMDDPAQKSQVLNSADSFSTKIPSSYYARQFVNGKGLGTFFGMILLVGSLAAGVILVTEPQLLGQKAASVGPQKCNPKSSCVFKSIPGSLLCIPIEEGGPNYCCPVNYKIKDGVCLSK